MQINWQTAKTYEDILYQKTDGIAKITINRPHKRNAFRPETVFELYDAFCNAREDTTIGVVLFTGYGHILMANMPSVLVAIKACGDMRVMWTILASLA